MFSEAKTDPQELLPSVCVWHRFDVGEPLLRLQPVKGLLGRGSTDRAAGCSLDKSNSWRAQGRRNLSYGFLQPLQMKWEICPVTGTFPLVTGLDFCGGPLSRECNFSFQLLNSLLYPYIHVYAIYSTVLCVSLCLEKKSREETATSECCNRRVCFVYFVCAKRFLHLLIF